MALEPTASAEMAGLYMRPCLPWKASPARMSRQVGVTAVVSLIGAMVASRCEFCTKLSVPRRGVQTSSRKRPHPFNGLTQDPVLVVGIKEFHVVPNDGQSFRVAYSILCNRPVRRPHQPLRPKGIVQALHQPL